MGLFDWHRLPVIIGLLRLNSFRKKMRQKNLYNTETLPSKTPESIPMLPAEQRQYRTIDGAHNDLKNPFMGRAGSRFGRNFPLNQVIADDQTLMVPSPREVSLRLMTRDKFVPAENLNLLAAAWIQFQIHDWFSHGENEKTDPFVVPLSENDTWPQQQMLINRTKHDHTRDENDSTKPDSYLNTETHWWDASQLYGSSLATMRKLRSYKDGKLLINSDGLLPVDPVSGIDVTGVSTNWWVGLSVLHTLFTMEHNVICDRLKAQYPQWSDEELFQKARLIVAAILAKIHTVEWTVGILNTPTLDRGMRSNWERIRGSKQDHHSAPYAITEEFVTVYRMHPLIPDDFVFYSYPSRNVILECTMDKVANQHSREIMNKVPLADLFYSFGVAHPGKITLHNYPKHLQELKLNGEIKMDLAAVDILRDRERGVPRYNNFRRLLDLDPINDFDDLSDNQEWCRQIREVYGNKIEAVDTMVGMFAEPLIPGFGFSETAFRIFLLMASRRLQSDRFFTSDYNEKTYTQIGLDWIEDVSMSKVILRHFPQLTPLLQKSTNAFAPWK